MNDSQQLKRVQRVARRAATKAEITPQTLTTHPAHNLYSLLCVWR
jgi:hypothetical protein